MWEILSLLLLILFISAVLVLAGLLIRGYLTTGSPTTGLAGAFFAPKAYKRLEVVDQAHVDAKRRLLLIRRDDVEHLIMTGGPIDVVIENNIAAPDGTFEEDRDDAAQPIFERGPNVPSR